MEYTTWAYEEFVPQQGKVKHLFNNMYINNLLK
jgi:hypothetical protein